MSEYTKTLDKIFFLNDKNVISSLDDTTVLLNPVTSLKVTKEIHAELTGRDSFISGEVNRLCTAISTDLTAKYNSTNISAFGISSIVNRLCNEVSNDITSKFDFIDKNFAHISGDAIDDLSVKNQLTATTLILDLIGKETTDPHETVVKVGIDGILLSVHGNDRNININTDNQLKINNKDLSSYLSETSESAYAESKLYTNAEILKLDYSDEYAQEHYFVTKVTETDGVIEVVRNRPTSADIDQLTEYVTNEIRLSNDSLSNEVSALMWRSATDLSNYINERVSTVYKPMGSVLTTADLVTKSQEWAQRGDVLSTHIGEVWNVVSGATETPDLSGQNYVFVNQGYEGEPIYGWDNIGGFIDFHQFYTKTLTDELTANLSSTLIAEVDRDFVRQDGSDPIAQLTVTNGLTAKSEYIELINANPAEFTKLSVGDQGVDLCVNGERDINITVPNGLQGITVNGTDVCALIDNAILRDINSLDVPAIDTTIGQVISKVWQTDGKVSAEIRTLTSSDINDLNAFVTDKIDELDVSTISSDHSLVYAVKEDNGKLTAYVRQIDENDFSHLLPESSISNLTSDLTTLQTDRTTISVNVNAIQNYVDRLSDDTYSAKGANGIINQLSDGVASLNTRTNSISTNVVAIQGYVDELSGDDKHIGIVENLSNNIEALLAANIKAAKFMYHITDIADVSANTVSAMFKTIDDHTTKLGYVKNGAIYDVDFNNGISASTTDGLKMYTGDRLVIIENTDTLKIYLKDLAIHQYGSQNGNVYIYHDFNSTQAYINTTLIDPITGYCRYISSWLSNNFGNTGSYDSLSTTILNYEVSATSSLTVDGDVLLKKDISVEGSVKIQSIDVTEATINSLSANIAKLGITDFSNYVSVDTSCLYFKDNSNYATLSLFIESVELSITELHTDLTTLKTTIADNISNTYATISTITDDSDYKTCISSVVQIKDLLSTLIQTLN